MLRALRTEKTFNKIKKSFSLYGHPVFYVRFSHGEMKALMDMDDGIYTAADPELMRELKEALLIDHPNYLIALNDVHPPEQHMTAEIFFNQKYRIRTDIYFSKVFSKIGLKRRKFENSICFHYYAAYKPKEFVEFFDIVRRRKKMFVGSLPKESCEKLLGPIDVYVQTPETQAYNSINEWWPLIEKGRSGVEVVFMACGPCAAVIGKRLWESGWRNSFITLGGSIDAAVGHTSGTRHREWIVKAKRGLKKLHQAIAEKWG